MERLDALRSFVLCHFFPSHSQAVSFRKRRNEIWSSSSLVNVKLSQQYPSGCNIDITLKQERGEKMQNNFKCRLCLDVTLLVFLSLCSHMLPDRLSKGEEVSFISPPHANIFSAA